MDSQTHRRSPVTLRLSPAATPFRVSRGHGFLAGLVASSLIILGGCTGEASTEPDTQGNAATSDSSGETAITPVASLTENVAEGTEKAADGVRAFGAKAKELTGDATEAVKETASEAVEETAKKVDVAAANAMAAITGKPVEGSTTNPATPNTAAPQKSKGLSFSSTADPNAVPDAIRERKEAEAKFEEDRLARKREALEKRLAERRAAAEAQTQPLTFTSQPASDTASAGTRSEAELAAIYRSSVLGEAEYIDPRDSAVVNSGGGASSDATGSDGGDDATNGEANDAASETGLVVLEPKTLEFGDIPTGDSKTMIVKVKNNSDQAYTLIDCKTSCGCTTTNCAKGQTLQPDDFVEVEIKLDGGAEPKKLNKNVTFLLSDGHPPLRLALQAQSVSFVQASPPQLDPGISPDGIITLTSIDNEPFVIKSAFPPVIDPVSTTPATEQTMKINWEEMYEEGANQRRMLVQLSHPSAKRITIDFSPNLRRVIREKNPVQGIDNAGRRPASNPADRVEELLKEGRDEEVIALIQAGDIEPDKLLPDGQSPLIKAARYGRAEVINLLIDRGVDIERGDSMGRNALAYAAQSKDIDAVRALLDAGADIENEDATGNTPICWAAGFGTAEIVQEFIDAGAKLDVGQGIIGFTPLIWAAGYGEAPSVEVLLSHNPNLEATDVIENCTALLHAVRMNKLEATKMLIEAGSRISARDKADQTALMLACINLQPTVEVVQVLLDAGADPNAVNNEGKTALDIARERRTGPEGKKIIAKLESVTSPTAGKGAAAGG